MWKDKLCVWERIAQVEGEELPACARVSEAVGKYDGCGVLGGCLVHDALKRRHRYGVYLFRRRGRA